MNFIVSIKELSAFGVVELVLRKRNKMVLCSCLYKIKFTFKRSIILMDSLDQIFRIDDLRVALRTHRKIVLLLTWKAP